ncbi:thioredoxin [Holospora obtusa F1]|uniref:Thioredoxin n=1 Tax=Holospora obtusa F1 TaxID=1399147 RepID=W6TFF1_HOLOB|nr:thioredoxin domain-containing protein [Holospora obtusa]ETZ06730.1 thioredoxin [Holospora obtusa F1]
MKNLDHQFIIESAKTHNVLVDCFATWCPPCKALLPVLESISEDAFWSQSLKIVKVNIDDNPSIATRYRIQSLPTLILFPKLKDLDEQVVEIARHIGGISEKALTEWLHLHLD